MNLKTGTVAAPVVQEQPPQGRPGDNRPGEDMSDRQPGNDMQMMEGNTPQPPGMTPMVMPASTATPTSSVNKKL